MNLLPTQIHGFVDYLTAAALIALPVIDRHGAGAQTWLPMLLGCGVLSYSLLTDYELGLAPIVSMPLHLGFDAAGGLLLAVSPWLFGFSEVVWIPHVAIGLFEVAMAAITRRHPSGVPHSGGRLGVSI